jgi:hypothetical protein
MSVALEKKKAILQTIEAEKNELAIKLLSLKDQSIVHTFRIIFDDLTGLSKKTKRISKSKYNKEIDAAVKRVRSGKSVSHEAVMNEMEKW